MLSEYVFHHLLYWFICLTISFSSFNFLAVKLIFFTLINCIRVYWTTLNCPKLFWNSEQKQKKTLKTQEETRSIREVSLGKGCKLKSLDLICSKSLLNILQWADLNGQCHRRRWAELILIHLQNLFSLLGEIIIMSLWFIEKIVQMILGMFLKSLIFFFKMLEWQV